MVSIHQDSENNINFSLRYLLATALVVVSFLILIYQLFVLQIQENSRYKIAANNNRIKTVPIVPNRGLIYDRHGYVLARNYAAYTLEITPYIFLANRKPEAKINHANTYAAVLELVKELESVITITEEDLKKFKKTLYESRSADSIPIKMRLTDEETAKFSVRQYQYPGVEIQARSFREYPLMETASHMIGYIGRISTKDNERIKQRSESNESDDPRSYYTNYLGTRYIGKMGVEQSYETQLHGLTGSENVEQEANGTVVRVLSQSPPVNGDNLILAADIRLQYLVEQLFNGRKGALVAIEPSTGDILAYVSLPNYNPNLFIDGIDNATWASLRDNPSKPMLNRGIQATYPPGSTFKPFMALSALMSGYRTPEYTIRDPGYYVLGNNRFRGHATGITNMHKSIAQSSNTYYYMLAHEMGIDKINEWLSKFGFGQATGIDLVGEKKGLLPSSEWKMKRYKQKWLEGETISVGIGQGYSHFTMTQLAHAVSIIANQGGVMRPHIVKYIQSLANNELISTVPRETRRLKVTPAQIRIITDAMVEVNRSGTGARAFAGFPLPVAGKTGTAQVKDLKGRTYNRSSTPEEFRDHSLFIAFAPADKPKIAIATVVENAGFGAEAAAPIVRAALDYYLLGKLPKRVEETISTWYRTNLSAIHGIPEIYDPLQNRGKVVETLLNNGSNASGAALSPLPDRVGAVTTVVNPTVQTSPVQPISIQPHQPPPSQP